MERLILNAFKMFSILFIGMLVMSVDAHAAGGSGFASMILQNKAVETVIKSGLGIVGVFLVIKPFAEGFVIASIFSSILPGAAALAIAIKWKEIADMLTSLIS